MNDQLTTAEQAYRDWRAGRWVSDNTKEAWFAGYDAGYGQGLGATTTDLLKGEKGGANAESD